MALGANQVTVTTAANFIPELWSPLVIKAVESKLVMWKLLWDWSDPAKGKGDTIHVPGVANLSTNSKAANTAVVLNANTEGVTNLSINTHEECSFLIEDIVKVQSAYNQLEFYKEKAGYAIAAKMDTDANTLVASFSQTQGAAGADLGDEQIRNAIEFLDLADAPDDDRHFLMHPSQKNALFAIEKYFKAHYRGDGMSDILVKGQFGEIYGMPTYVSTNVGTSAGSRLNAIFQRQAIAKAQQLGPRVQ